MLLGKLIKGESQEGKEKHVPAIELSKCKDCGESIVKITVGKEVPHPNTLEHHIKWIMVFGVKSGVAVHVGTFDLGPSFGVPTVEFHAKVGEFSELIAVEYCNIHGLWESAYSL